MSRILRFDDLTNREHGIKFKGLVVEGPYTHKIYEVGLNDKRSSKQGHELINCGDLDGKISFCGKALGVERCLSIVTDDMTLSTKRKRVAPKGRVYESMT